jgi:hypothetical protein
MKSRFYLLFFVFAITACPDKRKPVPVVPTSSVDGSMMYSNEFGALRVIKTGYEGGQLGSVAIQPFADVGFGDTLSFSTVFSDLGGVVRTVPGSSDWGPFSGTNTPYAAAVLVKKNNGQGADDHKSTSIYQWVGINQSQRSSFLFMNSVINGNVRKRLEEYNYYVRARNMRFIDRSSYLVSFTDYWRKETGKPRPTYIGVDDFVHYIMKFDFAAPDPTIGEVVASFRDQNMGVVQLYVSAKKNFYIAFTPRWETTGVSPFVIRSSDYQFAYTPFRKGAQGYDRAPGQEAFALDAHPRLDSVIAVSDNRFGTMLLRIPFEKEDRFSIESPILPHSDLVPYVPVQEAFYQHAWNIRFNFDGTRLAIASHVPSAAPFVAVWHHKENRLVKYTVPSVGGVQMTRVGKPAWDLNSPDKRFLFFLASNHNTNQGYIFFIDTDQPASPARAWAWDSVNWPDDLVPNAEVIRSVTEIVQRKE